jgi:hypothetical protein
VQIRVPFSLRWSIRVANVEEAATPILADADKSANADLHGFLGFVLYLLLES